MYLIILPLILNLDFVIEKWLHIVPQYVVTFCKLSLINLLIDSVSAPLGIAVQATGKIRVYQIWYSLLSLLVLPCAYLFTLLGISPTFVFAMWVVINTIIYIWKVVYVLGLVQIAILSYLKEVSARIGLILTISLPLVLLGTSAVRFEGWSALFYSSLISILITFSTIIVVGLKKDERNLIVSFIKNKIHK